MPNAILVLIHAWAVPRAQAEENVTVLVLHVEVNVPDIAAMRVVGRCLRVEEAATVTKENKSGVIHLTITTVQCVPAQPPPVPVVGVRCGRCLRRLDREQQGKS